MKPTSPPTEAPKTAAAKLRHHYEQTDVQCLQRRIGPEGTSYYGRVKRHGKVYLKRLGEDFQEAKRALRKWLDGVDEKAAAAATVSEEVRDFSTWGHFCDRYLTATDLDVALAPKSKSYRHECVGRIISVWNSMALENAVDADKLNAIKDAGLIDVDLDDLKKRKITTVTQESCQRWAAALVGYHVTTYNNTIGVFKRILQDAVESGHLLANPAAKLKRLGKRRLALARNGEAGQPPTPEELKSPVLPSTDKPWYPSPKEFAAIVKKMRSYKFGPCQAAADFAELLCYSGCRLSEGNRLRWCDVDWKRNIIKVDGAKERANSESEIRDVPILPALAGLLRRLQKRPHQPTDKIARVSECRGTMQHACVDLKMPRKLDHHDLRHTFATRSVAAGVPVPVVSDWLGHKDGGVLLLETYRHEDQTVSQRWAKRVKL